MAREWLKGYTRQEADQVLKAAGFKLPSRKQFHYWAQIGFLQPEHLNKKMPIYTFTDLVKLAMAMELDRAGTPFQCARKVIPSIIEVGADHQGVDLVVFKDEAVEVRSGNDVLPLLDGFKAWRYVRLRPMETVDRVYEAAEKVVGLARMNWDELKHFQIYPATKDKTQEPGPLGRKEENHG